MLAETQYHLGMSKINSSLKSDRDYKNGYFYLKKAADVGHVKAGEEIAFSHLFGNYLLRNITLARVLFEDLALKGSARAQFGLAIQYSTGLSVKSNQAKALVYYTFAALGGDPTAQMALGYRYWSGINVESSCETALSFYRKVATHVASQINPFSPGTVTHRVRLYDEEENASAQQNQGLLDDDLVQYYQLLADRGDMQAQYGLGLLHYQGGRGEMQYDRALHYFSRAAEGKNYYAMAYLGKLYLEGGPHIKQDNQTAYRYFKTAADNGNPIGQAGVGIMYFHGSGRDKDYAKALKYFQLSSDQGYVEGHFLLGIMHYYGHGTSKDYKSAVKYFKVAAELGHVLANFNLAQMHATGTGVIRSCQISTELYKNVAERGQWSKIFMEAHSAYKEGDLEKSLIKYIYLSELGYEVAQSNVAHILDQCKL
jgi:SEL1 protein